MARDIRIPVMVTPEEYVAFRVVADDAGQSLSGAARQLIRRAIEAYAHRESIAETKASATAAQD